jgi:hypothetical protein
MFWNQWLHFQFGQAVQRLLGVDACAMLRVVTIIVAIKVWKVLQ